MIKKILQYLAFYIDNLVNNLFPSKNHFKRWKEVDDFRQQSYIRSSVYAFIALCLILYSYIGWHFLWLPSTLGVSWCIWWLVGYIKTKRNGRK